MVEFLFTERRQFVADHCHSMPGYTEPRHGHNWELEATVRNNESFCLGPLLDSLINTINYSFLSELPYFDGKNATAETVAQFAFQFLETKNLKPVIVRIKEKSHYWAACMYK